MTHLASNMDDLKMATMFSPTLAFWVTDTIGTCAYGDCYESGVVVVDCRDLADGPNPSEPVWVKIKTALNALQSGQRVLLQCAAGVSRSNAIAAAVISLRESIPYGRALGKVREKVPRANPNQPIQTSVQHAIREHGPSGSRGPSRWRK